MERKEKKKEMDIGKKTMAAGNGSLEEEQPYAYWLAQIKGLGGKTRKELVEYAGSPKLVYGMKRAELKGLLPEKKIDSLVKGQMEGNPVEQYEKLRKREIDFIPVYHPLYPAKLKNIEDAPFGIYTEGSLPEEARPSVAVIGARECSEYGRYMAQVCGKQLAEAGINVISGMARGIDGISQNAALKAGGLSYSVLGCGTNVCYPAENRNIYIAVKKCGGIISEYPPDTQPSPRLFPLRNRIISGLSDLVLIIEARNRSGTLITADLALEQGKEVYVVPGRVTDALSEGCNRLLKQGAGIMTSVQEMLEETGLLEMAEQRESAERKEVGEEDNKLLDALDFYPKSIDTLIQETGVEYRRLVCEMMKLCMEGKAQQISAGQFVKKRQ